MLRIDCPYCGPRDQTEFYCGGEARVLRPQPASAASDAEWADYLFYRDNRKGRHAERWLHVYGCRQWFLVIRDTATNEIWGVHRLDEAPGAFANLPPEAGT